MFQLLSYICSELNCYLDEIKGRRKGNISNKRRIIIISLFLVGMNAKQIAKILNKNEFSIYEARKIASFDEKQIAEKLLMNYHNWTREIKK